MGAEPIIDVGEDLVWLINGYIAYLKSSKQGSHEPGANQSVRESDEAYFPGIPAQEPYE